jgi:hypothetical protein
LLAVLGGELYSFHLYADEKTEALGTEGQKANKRKCQKEGSVL